MEKKADGIIATVKGFRLRYKHVAVLLVLLLTISLIPLCLMANYNAPCADDFTYSDYIHLKWQETGSLSHTLQAALEKAQQNYYTWQGTFTTIFLMALQPSVWGEQFYFLTTYIMLAFLIAGTGYLSKVLLRDYLHADWNACLGIQALLMLVSIQKLPYAVQAIYWYNGSVHYMVPYGSMLLVFGLLLRNQKNGKSGIRILRIIFASILAFLVGGGNYVTALTLPVVLFVMLFIKIITKQRKRYIDILIPFSIELTTFGFSIMAPGNAIRQAYTEGMGSPIRTIFKSMYYVIQATQGWVTWLVIVGVILCVPFMISIVKKIDFSFPCPLLVTMVSFGVLSAMFCPMVYSTQGAGAGRCLNPIFLLFMFLLFLNVLYDIGWLTRRFPNLSKMMSFEKNDIITRKQFMFLALFAFAFVFVFCLYYKYDVNEYNSISALYSIRSSEAQIYKNIYDERVELLKGDQTDIVLPDYFIKPYLLYFDDITTNPTDWRNNSVAIYYGKSTVILENQSDE